VSLPPPSGAGFGKETVVSNHGEFSRTVFTGVLVAVALFYCAAGFFFLVVDTPYSYPIDLRLRWIEQKEVVSRLDPQLVGHPDAELLETHEGMKGLGGAYPPWSYTTAMLFYPPLSWEALRWYYASICALSVGLILWWASRLFLPPDRMTKVLAAASVTAVFPTAICISYGQFAVIIAACFALSLWLLERRRDGWAGILLGIALTKPHTAGLFALALLIRGRFRALAFAFAYLVLANCITWLLVGSDPLSMLRRASEESGTYLELSTNPLTFLLTPHFSPRSVTLSLGLVGTLAAIVLLLKCRRAGYPLVVDFSVCAILSMFWASYRKNYDCALLVFPLATLLTMCPRSRLAVLLFLLFGISLWVPIRADQWDLPVIQYAHLVIWLSGLVGLMCWGRLAGPPRDTADVPALAVPWAPALALAANGPKGP
jgi:hypothetical protein